VCRDDLAVNVLVVFAAVCEALGLDQADLEHALEATRGAFPAAKSVTRAQGAEAPRASPRLLTADEMSTATGVPATWFAEAARQQSIPHYKIGKYTRFDPSAVLGSERFLKRAR
jgi:hypothetical protein